MPERDGTTCTTCLTLNPPGAPACVRCNSPLADQDPGPSGAGPADPRPVGAPAAAGVVDTRPIGPAPDGIGPDPTLGSQRIGPGLAAGAPGAPGSSRTRAAAVQPPGYGPDVPRDAPGPAPEPDTAIARRVTVVGLVLVAVVLLGGGGAMWLTRARYLDSADVQTAVGAELTERGGAPVTVDCPGDPRHRTGEEFRCVATDRTGGRRTVTVTVLDDAGRYRWELAP